MDSYDQLQSDVFYLAGRKSDYAAAMARIDRFAAEATGLDAGRALWLRGGVLREQGRLREAVAVFRQAADQLDGDPHLLAACLLDCASLANVTGDLDAADAMADRFFALAEAYPEAREFREVMQGARGDTCFLRGDVVGAIECHRRALRQLEDPFASTLRDSERLCMLALHWHSLVRCYLALGDLVRARFAIEGVRHCRHPDLRGLAAYDEFQVSLCMGALAQAERWLDEAEQLIHDALNRQFVLFGRIRLALANGDDITARRYLEQLQTTHELIHYEIRTQLDILFRKEEALS